MTSPSRSLYEALRARLSRGVAPTVSSVTAACAGLVLPGLRSVSLPMDGSGVELTLAPGCDLRGLPSLWRCEGVDVPLRTRHGANWRMQAATAERQIDSNGIGTVGALVRDRFDATRFFILTCGHVLAGTPSVRRGDAASILVGSVSGVARLVDWEPTLGNEVVRTGLDAAIADIEGDDLLRALQAMTLPNGSSGDYGFDQPVRVMASSEKTGLLKARWSGFVDVADTALDIDYFLDDAVSYLTTPGTVGGDSGAGVWDEDTGALLGLHVAAPGDDEQFRANAVMCPIGPIMDWFDIDPISSQGGVAQPRPRLLSTPPPARVAPEPDSNRAAEQAVIAKTLWGEARGEPPEGMQAVASVIERRRQLGWRKAKSAAQVCLTPFQFSCWNKDDPNRVRMDAVARQPDAAYERALVLAGHILDGDLDENAEGATHYYALSLRKPPFWAVGRTPCCRRGNHLFFKDIG